MLRLISDQNFSGRILRGIGLRIPDLDLVRALDAGLTKAPDSALLQWAAEEDRILLTHDVNIIPRLRLRSRARWSWNARGISGGRAHGHR
jgi:hypothetical protein